MPEGDTVHGIAGALAPRLVGHALAGGRVRGMPGLELAGERVAAVRARGKHLFVELEDGRALRSHLGMHGAWHRYAPGEAWRRPERAASIVLATADEVLVCFRAEEVELLGLKGQAAFDLSRRLGPDLVREPPARERLARRVRAFLRPQDPVVDLLLEQRVASGIGNVYKSELLFLERVAPATPVGALDWAAVERLYARAHRLLAANVSAGPRRTRAGSERLWVYRRRGRACLACGTAIEGARMGRGARSTYWCPSCQGAGAEGAPR